MLVGLVLDTQKFVQYTTDGEWAAARRPEAHSAVHVARTA